MATNGIPSIVENRIVENSIEENSIEENSSSNSSSVKELLYNSKVEKLQKIFIETIGSTNINNIKECINYLDKLPFELIEYALRKTARVERPSWKYAIPILESYIAKKFTTITEVQADDLKYKSKTTNPKETEEEKTARRLRELEGGTEK